MISLTRPKQEKGRSSEKNVGIIGEYKILGKTLKITKQNVIYDGRGCSFRYLNPICIEAAVVQQRWLMVYEANDKILRVCQFKKDGLEERKKWRKIEGRKESMVGKYRLGNNKMLKVLSKGGCIYDGKKLSWKKYNSKSCFTKIRGVGYLLFYDPEVEVMVAYPSKYCSNLRREVTNSTWTQSAKIEKNNNKSVFGPGMRGDWIWKGKIMRIGTETVYYKNSEFPYEKINNNTIFIKELEGESYILTYDEMGVLYVGMFNNKTVNILKQFDDSSSSEEEEEYETTKMIHTQKMMKENEIMIKELGLECQKMEKFLVGVKDLIMDSLQTVKKEERKKK